LWKIYIATLEGSDRLNVLGIGSTKHLSVVLLPTQVVVFDLLLILCSVCFVATLATTPTVKFSLKLGSLDSKSAKGS
jgi:hypothetical protein